MAFTRSKSFDTPDGALEQVTEAKKQYNQSAAKGRDYNGARWRSLTVEEEKPAVRLHSAAFSVHSVGGRTETFATAGGIHCASTVGHWTSGAMLTQGWNYTFTGFHTWQVTLFLCFYKGCIVGVILPTSLAKARVVRPVPDLRLLW